MTVSNVEFFVPTPLFTLTGVPVELWATTGLSLATLLHNLLIAVNRACSIVAPVYYQQVWTRRSIVASVVACWLMNFVLRGYVFVEDIAVMKNSPLPTATWWSVYTSTQYATTYPSLALYTGVLAWVALVRRKSSVSPRRTLFNAFLYCFISFLPNCYYLFFTPPKNQVFNFFVIARLSINSVLLVPMSSLVRRKLPFRRIWSRGEKQVGVQVVKVASRVENETCGPTNGVCVNNYQTSRGGGGHLSTIGGDEF